MSFLNKLGITDKDSFIKFIKQFIKFGLVGISNTLISLSIYYLFIYISKNLYMLGNALGFIVSVLNSYFWNNKFVFKSKEKNHFKKIMKTYVSYGFTFVLSSILLMILVELISVSEIFAPLITLVITVPLNFLINKFWTFKK